MEYNREREHEGEREKIKFSSSSWNGNQRHNRSTSGELMLKLRTRGVEERQGVQGLPGEVGAWEALRCKRHHKERGKPLFSEVGVSCYVEKVAGSDVNTCRTCKVGSLVRQGSSLDVIYEWRKDAEEFQGETWRDLL